MRFLICLILLSISLTSNASSKGDFFLFEAHQMRAQRTGAQSFSAISPSCRDRIRQIVCLVDAPKSPDEVRPCQTGSDIYAEPIAKIYDLLPEKVQNAFCSLDVIYIENSLESLAYAGTRRGATPDKESGFMGIRRILVEQAYDATSVLGWKEQKSFGIQAPPFVHMPQGPRVEIALPGSLTALQYVIVHELGHILDFSNKANDFMCPAGETCNLNTYDPKEFAKLIPTGTSWSTLSWKNPLVPKDEYHFPLWDKLCFYGCSDTLTVNDMEEFYRDLDKTNFVTTYSAVSPYEDFAESFAFYILTLQGPWSYRIQTPQNAYSLDIKWSKTSDKKIWMDSFYNRDLKYPTPAN